MVRLPKTVVIIIITTPVVRLLVGWFVLFLRFIDPPIYLGRLRPYDGSVVTEEWPAALTDTNERRDGPGGDGGGPPRRTAGIGFGGGGEGGAKAEAEAAAEAVVAAVDAEQTEVRPPATSGQR